MKFSKYNEAQSGTTTIGAYIPPTDSGNNNNNNSSGGSRGDAINRKLWGNQDNGNNSIDDTIKVEGDIYAYAYADENDDNTTTDRFTFPTNQEGGNIYADRSVRSPEIYATQHLCVNHPSTHVKTDILDLLIDYDDRITTNANNISTNTNNITSLQQALTALQTTVGNHTTTIYNHTTNISNNADEIEALKSRLAALETSGDTGDNLPIGTIIMFNGQASAIPENWHICDGTNGTPNLIGRFIKADNTAGDFGGSNTIKLKDTDIPKLNVWRDDEAQSFISNARLNSYIPMTPNQIQEASFDTGGSTNYTLYTGRNAGDNGYNGYMYKYMIADVLNSGAVGATERYQTSVDITPKYYSLIYIMKIA